MELIGIFHLHYAVLNRLTYPGTMLMIRPPCKMVFTALSKSGPSTSPENIQVRMSADIGADHLRTEIAHLHIFHKMRRTRKL